MERITRSNKSIEAVSDVKAPVKRGRKKKSEIMNDIKEQQIPTLKSTPQNIRRSLRGKTYLEAATTNDQISVNAEVNLNMESIESTLEEPSLSNSSGSCNNDINVLEKSMSRCDLIDEKYPIVLLHQLSDSNVSPKKETPTVANGENLIIEIKHKAEHPNDNIDDKMEVADEQEEKSQSVDPTMELKRSYKDDGDDDDEDNDMTKKKDDFMETVKQEIIYEQQENIETEKEDNSFLRRSRRLKSIFIETNIGETSVLEVQKIEPIQQVQLQEIKQESFIKLEKVESDNLHVYEPIDVETDARLSQFITIKDNIYLKPSDKVICKINKTMKCDCTITEDEIKNGELGCTFNCINRLLYIECSPKCRCGEFCDNQQFQRCNYASISVVKTEKKGFGIKADADIPPETFIIEYVGEVLNNKQFEKRANKYSKDKNRHYYFMALRSNAVIDATVKGNISRFINHSCNPNAITQKWTINGELRVGFFSVRFIKKGEEITFDYQFQRYGKEAQRCYCESENCRGWIGENPESDEEVLDNAETSLKDKKLVGKSKKVPTVKSSSKPKPKLIESDDVSTEEIREPEIKKAVESSIKSEKRTKKLYEDLEIEEQINELTKSGLKNRAHTISLARLVVRAKSVESRGSILKILISGELPCKRLFLDYNGLKLLHNWMCDIAVKSSIPDLCLCIELINALSLLPITNKTVLRDSKVLERVEKWKNLDIEKKKLSKEEKKQAKADKKKNKTSSLDPSESIKEETNNFNLTFDVLEELPTMKMIVKEKAAALLQKWEVLKEDFRIPKKQKQENRKEHEKEAGMEEDLCNDSRQKAITDRARNRFGHETSSRNSTSYQYGTSTASNTSQYQSSSYRRYLNPLEKQHRRKLFEKQELEKRMWAEHENNCAMFGLPIDTPLTNIPVKVNRVTGECYQIFGSKVMRPPNFHEFKYEPLTLSTNPDDYHLPSIDLPEHWRFAIDKLGRIYYYHEKIRISQWEAPIKILPLFSNDEDNPEEEMSCNTYENLGTPDDDESSTDTEDSEEEELCSLLDMLKRKKRKLNGYVGLVEQITTGISDISGVEEDLEKRIKLNSSITKPLDNPVKISAIDVSSVKRKKRRGLVTMMKFIRPRTEEEKFYGRNESRRYKEVKEMLRRQKKKRLQQGEGCGGEVPDIFDEDDEDVDEACFSSKMVDELDILTKSKHLEKIRKLKSDVEFADPLKTKKQACRPMLPTDQSLIKRQFRDDIKEEIAKYLLPYRSETCTHGKIECEEDYNSLINKLTFSVLTKESKHCAQNNSMLKATDSVKGKTKEFIKKYMSKFEGVYRRKADEQDYSLILNKY